MGLTPLYPQNIYIFFLRKEYHTDYAYTRKYEDKEGRLNYYGTATISM